ncbi:hypothetical protein K7G98_06695 [Saccharothrix sp. MB29]|nr:hypothetical protein [Saccharothrix sp. MB29]
MQRLSRSTVRATARGRTSGTARRGDHLAHALGALERVTTTSNSTSRETWASGLPRSHVLLTVGPAVVVIEVTSLYFAPPPTAGKPTTPRDPVVPPRPSSAAFQPLVVVVVLSAAVRPTTSRARCAPRPGPGARPCPTGP